MSQDDVTGKVLTNEEIDGLRNWIVDGEYTLTKDAIEKIELICAQAKLAAASTDEVAQSGGELVMAKLDSREFYEVMQIYRHAPIEKPAEVVEAFEAVKAWLRALEPAALPVAQPAVVADTLITRSGE